MFLRVVFLGRFRDQSKVIGPRAKVFGVLTTLSHFFWVNCKKSPSYVIGEKADFQGFFASLLYFVGRLTRKWFKIAYQPLPMKAYGAPFQSQKQILYQGQQKVHTKPYNIISLLPISTHPTPSNTFINIPTPPHSLIDYYQPHYIKDIQQQKQSQLGSIIKSKSIIVQIDLKKDFKRDGDRLVRQGSGRIDLKQIEKSISSKFAENIQTVRLYKYFFKIRMIVMLQKGFQSMFQQKTLSFKKNPQFQQTQIILPPHNQSHRDIIHLSNRQCQDKLKKQKLKMINLINLQLFCLVDSSGAYETDIQLFHVLHFINIICILSTQSAQDTLVECHLDFTIKKIQELNKKYPSIDAQTYEQIIHLSNIFSTVTRAQIYSFFGKILCKYGKKLKAILPYYYEHFLLAYEKEQFFADHKKVSTSDIKDYLKRLLPIKNKLKQLCTFTT